MDARALAPAASRRRCLCPPCPPLPAPSCCLARELTKRHEEFWRGSLAQAAAEFSERPGGPRGEFVLLVEGAGGDAAGPDAAGGDASEEAVVAALQAAVAAGESPSGAAKSVAARLGVSRKLAYALSLRLAGQQQEGEQPTDGTD